MQRKVKQFIAKMNRQQNIPAHVNPDTQYSRFVISPYHGTPPQKKPHYTCLMAWIKRNLSTKQSILEVGCGTGLFGEWLRRKGYKHYVGVDINKLLVDIGKEAGNLNLQVMDGRHLQFEDDSYDFVGFINCFNNYEKDTCRRFVIEGLRVSRQWIEFDGAETENYAPMPTREEVQNWLGDRVVCTMDLPQKRRLYIAKV